MGNYYTFHKTVQGHLHVRRELPCEDYSDSYSEENGRFYIAAVADGHGDAACMRSAEGSRRAIRIARECLTEFANDNGALGIKGLTDKIVSCWTDEVTASVSECPLSEEEIAGAGKFADSYREGERLAHAYGTTLIAALLLPDRLILIQQGDGRCDVFYEDGTVEQPIPWDDRCFENVTTSMCDEDAATGIRSCVIPLEGRKVIACYLGSDGVEDSYRNMDGTHMFYRSLTCKLQEMGTEEFENYLGEMLPEFSKKGSGDDVSVGGIVDLDAIVQHVPLFQKQIRQYRLEEELEWYEGRKVSMSRKHGILQKRRNEAQDIYDEKRRQLNAETAGYQEMKEKCARAEEHMAAVEKRWNECVKQLKEAEAVGENAEAERGRFWGNWSFIQREEKPPKRYDIQGLKRSKVDLEQNYRQLRKQRAALEQKMSQQTERIKSADEEVVDARARYQDAQDNFEEYDHTYQEVQEEIDRIHGELAEGEEL